MSTSSEKIAKDQLNYAVRTLTSATLSLRERYYASNVSFNTEQITKRIANYKKKLENPTVSFSEKSINQCINQLEDKLSRKFINQLEWSNEAKDSFDAKILKVSTRLVEFGIAAGRIAIEKTWIESSNEMSFVITGESRDYKKEDKYLGTAHARLIWVECFEKASHWRFICTLRDKPGTINNPTTNVSTSKGRGSQVAELNSKGLSAKEISEKLNMNISYTRTLLRKLK